MSHLRRFLRRRGGDFYDEADRSGRVPTGEVDVATSALDGGGPVADALIRQLREAPAVWRLREPDGRYELRLSTSIDIPGVPTDGRESADIDVETVEGRALRLRLVIHEA